MLTQVVVQSSMPMTFDIESADPDEILIVKSISGLSSASNTLFTGEFARDGGYYQGRRAAPRNPVIEFMINPDYANDIEASDIRELLYRTFMEPQTASDAVQVLLKDDRKPDRYFIGYAESIEADLFSKELSAQVSMLCTDPFLRSVEEVSVTTDQGWIQTPINYEGTADTGIEFTALVSTSAPRLNFLTHSIAMSIVGSYKTGDVISINTNPGERHVRKNGQDIMAELITPNWITLRSQSDLLQTYATDTADGRVQLMSYKYRAAWRGI